MRGGTRGRRMAPGGARRPSSTRRGTPPPGCGRRRGPRTGAARVGGRGARGGGSGGGGGGKGGEGERPATASGGASGAWPSAGSSAAVNGEYRYDQDAVAGDSFTWVPPLTEAGSYTVSGHYVATSNASAAAPFTVYYSGGSHTYTVNQQSGTGGVWATLGTVPFVAGTAGKVVLGDGPASTSTRVIADATRFQLWGSAVWNPAAANVWHTFPVRNILPSLLSGSAPNDGFVVRASTQSTFNQGGPRYEASRYAYQ